MNCPGCGIDEKAEDNPGVNIGRCPVCKRWGGRAESLVAIMQLKDAVIGKIPVTLVVEGVSRQGVMLECSTKLGEGTKVTVLLHGVRS